MIRKQDALDYHSKGRPGKIGVTATKSCITPREIRLAYLPGATFPAEEIAKDPAAVFRYTSRGNLVGVVTDGSAVPGMGNVGPRAAKPVQEGIAILLKRLADIDVYYLELNQTDADGFVETMRLGLGGQVSFSTTRPGITRGNHFHTRKIERFVVV